MAAEVNKAIELEIAHVLFTDIVGYSKLPIHQQRAVLERLNEIVRCTDEFQAAETAGRLIIIPTGDGITLVFYRSPEAPVECALEISRMLKKHPELQLRMGIHSGPVSGVIDAAGKANVAGAGINIAQRVMACGDAGHILLSKHVAEDLEEYPHWQPHLHELGECEVKHGVRVSVVNLYTGELGNPAVPEKLKAARLAAGARKKRAALQWVSGTVTLLAIVTLLGFLVFRHKRSFSTAELPVPEKSIAVLPFENRSRDPDNAYFADGIQDEILTRLAKIADLKVISRASTQWYQSKPGNLSEIAAELGVANILEGSVQKAGNQVRVNVHLVNAQTGSQIWAETYDRSLSDIFAVESEIAKGIADSLQARLSGGEEQALGASPTNNPEAYDAYLRGLAFEARSNYSSDALFKAIDFYDLAVRLDPNFALAWARLSGVHALLYSNRRDITAARCNAAKAALENAQKLQPNAPETLLFTGYYQYWVLHDSELAKATFERVSKKLPGSSEVLYALAAIARTEGRWDESIAYWQRGLALNPRNTALITEVAFTYAAIREFSRAEKLYDRALDILPNEVSVMALKASIYQAEGNLEEAGKLLASVDLETNSDVAVRIRLTQWRLERNHTDAMHWVQGGQDRLRLFSGIDKGTKQLGNALVHWVAGDTAQAKAFAEEARNTIEPLRKEQPENPFVAAALAVAYALLEEKESALDEAQRAIRLLPSNKDRLSGPAFEENLALVETITGDSTRAIATLTRLLQTPYGGWLYSPAPITPALLRLDPIWDPLRSDPAFKKLYQEKQH
jgi:TolB-like protein/class 3 adenylate cyclase/cytochrome c-type biogenesis protein CcmH/NrfG